MATLADIGRSRAGSDLANFIVDQRQRKLENLRADERTAAYSNYTNTLADVHENKLRQMREKRIRNKKKIPIKVMQDRFPVKAVGDYFGKLAQSYNYVDANGMIERQQGEEIHAQMNSDTHKANVMGMRMEAAQKEYETLLRASKDPSGKLLKELNIPKEEVSQRLNILGAKYANAAGSLSGYMDFQKMEQKKRDADIKAQQAAAKAPTSRTVTRGGETVTEQWDGTKWVEVGRGPRSTSGTSLTVGPEGEVTFLQGNIPATKTTRTGIQKKLIDINDSIGRVKNIVSSYRRDFQTLGTRWQNMWTAGKEKFGLGKAPTKEDKQELADITKFRTESISNINEEIHRLTGAQMSRWEAKRITKGLPNPGTGFFDGDSPTEFETKLVSTYQNLLKVKARYLYYETQGFDQAGIKKLVNSKDVISLDGIMKKIDERGAELEATLKSKQPNANPDDIRKTVEGILAKEFGWEF